MKKDTYINLKKLELSAIIKQNHKKKNLRCLIFGNFGVMNLGDEAILAGQLEELKTVNNLNVIIVSRNPNEIKRTHNQSSLQLFNLRNILKEIKKSDFIIVGGGGLICKPDRGVVGIMYQLYMLFLYMLLPRFFNKKIYAIGIGIYSNSNALVLRLATRLLKYAELITVRDSHSYSYLKSKNIYSHYYKDSSFLMNLVSIKEIQNDMFIKKYFDTTKTNIGLALLKPDNRNAEKKLISELLNFVKINNNNTDYWFYACDFQKGFSNDRKFAEIIYQEIKKELGPGVTCHFIPPTWNAQKFFSSFKLMNFLITMRFHASVFAYRNNIKFLSINYDEKCSSFMNSIGKTQMDMNQINLSNVRLNLNKL